MTRVPLSSAATVLTLAFPDVIVRKALADLRDRVRESAKASGIPLKPEWIEGLVQSEKKSGYRLGVGVVVVE